VDLSIIIVAFNNREYLRACLSSIYENSGQQIKYEIFVVDNNSQDQTVKMLQENYPGVKIIDNPANLGFARANNQAMRLASGRYLLLLNNDTFVLGGSLEKMIEYMDLHREAGALSPRLLNGDGRTVQTQGGGWTRKKWLSASPQKVRFISGAAFLIRRDTYKNVGALDENFFFYNEDVDWCKRILKNGWEIHYYPGAAVIHYGGQSTGFIGARAAVEGLRGGLYLVYKHYRYAFPLYVLLFLILLLFFLAGNIIFWPFALDKKVVRGRIAAYGQVLWLALTARYKPKTVKPEML
jgi:GT2 family glycosyltransferase